MSLLPATAIERLEANDPTFTTCKLADSSTFKITPDDFAVAIAKALETNEHCTTVLLSNCGISSMGAIAFAEMLKVNKTVTDLDLDNNKITNEGIQAILEAIKDNNTLLELHLLGNTVPGEGALTKLVESFEYNTKLVNIIWRLESRQSFKINQCLTRNKEIARRLKAGKSVDDVDPNIRRETEKRILAEREAGVPQWTPPVVEEEPTEAPPATGGPYPLGVLKAKLLPEDVDPMKKEEYLSDDDFKAAFKMDKDEFARSPQWKRKTKKKELGLF
eukprot:CAMPEP_0114618628 /NCGR_PEP_ID=MMETSP0168-20121206/7797_1 /TAXON_ID=95228 ORGANISM="Vannella sp., Strain DIVA3 517/6/12" /NCGR_SAMPLE_ID=MMETSP0168 /ASSEMBLY_ACC=CAM_ASM_000044 /LENGTH=274 /DNA_ID=CAMNT_0001829773 /DNA_START=29 /DNA_END=853 /DNA_ORIENTATION=+